MAVIGFASGVFTLFWHKSGMRADVAKAYEELATRQVAQITNMRAEMDALRTEVIAGRLLVERVRQENADLREEVRSLKAENTSLHERLHRFETANGGNHAAL